MTNTILVNLPLFLKIQVKVQTQDFQKLFRGDISLCLPKIFSTEAPKRDQKTLKILFRFLLL